MIGGWDGWGEGVRGRGYLPPWCLSAGWVRMYSNSAPRLVPCPPMVPGIRGPRHWTQLKCYTFIFPVPRGEFNLFPRHLLIAKCMCLCLMVFFETIVPYFPLFWSFFFFFPPFFSLFFFLSFFSHGLQQATLGACLVVCIMVQIASCLTTWKQLRLSRGNFH